MHPVRKQKLLVLILILSLLGVAAGLILYALRDNISLFYTTSAVMRGETKPGQVFRLGGLVKKGSVQHLQGLTVRFTLTDMAQEIVVEYTGLLPDLFREGQGIVTQGQMSPQGMFMAKEVLAKHDENYRPDLSKSKKEPL